MDASKLSVLSCAYSQAETKTAVFDDSCALLWTNDEELFGNISNEDFFTPNLSPIGASEIIGLNKIDRQKKAFFRKDGAVYSADILPLFENDKPDGFIVSADDAISMLTKLSDTPALLGWSKYLALMREISSAVAFTSESLCSELEKLELYDAAKKADALKPISNKALSCIANLEEITKYSQRNFTKQTASLSDFLENAVLSSIPKLRKNNAEIIYSIEPEIEATIDFDRFLAAFLNIVANGVLYNISEKKKITIHLSMLGDNAVLTVSDNGTGIAPDKRELLFSPFALSELSKSNEGLGLCIVKLFCQEHGATLTYTTRENEGTSITISIPAQKNGGTLKVSGTNYIYERFSPVDIILNKANLD